MSKPSQSISEFFTDFPIVRGRRKFDPSSLNVVSSFDIETTSYYERDDGKCISIDEFYKLNKKQASRYEKRAILVAWGFGLNGKIIFGRTWDHFIELCQYLQKRYKLDPKKLTLPIYIHNESYEFQWIRKRFQWESIFAVSERYPIRALNSMGIEFRDSLIISGMSLDSTAKLCHKYPCKKLKGSWDYKKLRGAESNIMDEEWHYLENDNIVVMNYIQELLEEYKNINRIPMTKTGFVREDVRNACFWDTKSHKKDHNGKFRKYSLLMNTLTIDGAREYNLMKSAFTGGFTHANSLNAGIVHHLVTSYDISSSYPAVICSERFPMGKGVRFKPKDMQELTTIMKSYCVVMDITIEGLKSSFPYEHTLSVSKCSELEVYEEDNGRLISAKKLRIVITEVDYECLSHFYRWDKVIFNDGYKYIRGYLPKPIIERTITYYEGKTTLKGVEGEEGNYARLKTLVNSIFGCMVMDVVKNNITYDDEEEWSLELKDVDKEIEKYNKSKSRFLFYLWGVYICKYAMRNIQSAILECGKDHIYTDTDSEKCKNAEKHIAWFERYNALITRKIRKCLEYHNIDPSRANPKTIEGKHKPLGVFEVDGVYTRFMTLGAKRYFVEYDKPEKEDKPWTKYNLTISGVNKEKAIPQIYKRMQKEGKDFFDYFYFGAIFDRETCGKLLHTYIDIHTKGIFTDFEGRKMQYDELSSVHLEETTYKMTATDEYMSLLNENYSISYID